MRGVPDEDGYQRPAIISEKDLKGFDEILQNDSQDGWAAAKGDIDYNAKLVFSDDEDSRSSNRDSKGADIVPAPESGKPGPTKGPEKGECRPPGPAGPKLPSGRNREPGWDAPPGQQQPAQQRAVREPPQAPAYLDRDERGRKAWGSAELQPQPAPLSQQAQQAPPAQAAPVRQWPQASQGAPPAAAAPRATAAPPLEYLARSTPPAATAPPAMAAAGFPTGRVGPPPIPQQPSHHTGFGVGPVAPSRGTSRPGLDQLTGDEEELWRQRRQQQNDEMAVTVERTRQRREEEEKRYEQIKQSSAATAAAATAANQQQQPSVPEESAPVPAEKEDLDQRSCHSSESREEARGGALLPNRERPDFRQQSSGGYQQNYQRPFKNMPPRFLKKAEMQRQQQLRQQQQQQQQQQPQPPQQPQPQQAQQQQPPQSGGGLAPPQGAPSSLGGMGGVSYDPRWVAMGAGGPYLGQLGMVKPLGSQRPPEPEVGTPYPSAEDRTYEAREARPLECWPPGAGRPAPPQADRPQQPLAPPMAPPHVPPGGPYDNWRPSVAPVYYGGQVADFGRTPASYDQRLEFPPKRPDKEEASFDSRSRGDAFRKDREFEDKQQREKRENRDVMGTWSNAREYDQRAARDKWERETQPSRPDSRDSRASRDSLRDERAMPPVEQRQDLPMQQIEPPHRLAPERVKEKPQVADWSDTPYSAAGENKRRDWHTHHPPPVTQQQLDSAGPSKKNFVALRRGGVAKDDGKEDIKEGKVEDHSRTDEEKSKEVAKKDDADKRAGTSRSRGGSGGRFETNRGRGGRGGNGYGGVGYRGRSREYRRSRTERGPRFDRKKEEGSEESSGMEEDKAISRLRPKEEESEGSDEVCMDADRKSRAGKECGRTREPRRDETKNKEEKSAFSPRGEPSRRGRGGAVSLGRSARGRYPAGGYGPPTSKAPFGKPEEGNKDEETNKEVSQGSKPRSNSSRPVARRPNRMEPLPPRFQKNQSRRQDNPDRNKGRGGRSGGPNKDALSDHGNEDWETASESSDVADRRPPEEGARQQPPGSKKTSHLGQRTLEVRNVAGQAGRLAEVEAELQEIVMVGALCNGETREVAGHLPEWVEGVVRGQVAAHGSSGQAK
uniref:Putative thyroid hormone receptor-associated protein complex subunit n=1 Tax=Amblyomma triste TaxID=251400 RepID=A0A023GCG3_AMBTT